jgi:hypothetical protein
MEYTGCIRQKKNGEKILLRKCEENNLLKVTTITVYAIFFMYCLLLEDASLLRMFRFSYEPSSGNIP